ncbi:hypothetical protein [Vibrio breoganii]|uniref:hypothetical protein n=1 Tax=Vibrio breoganii TaxID=553239 RepID=UPI000C816532|nr:hypothetical protein [Vibrio breoganii]PMK20862.1 hypothetical protein BCU06_05950 [Vibrio breoganii]PMK58197.1 hypothetical protein BCT98_06895 [Vibrio breoganii]PMK71541.1 hypothetical protein BCT94_14295 [Vibrio breoganii]
MTKTSKRCITLSSAILVTLSFSACSSDTNNYSGSGSITQGAAKTIEANIFECENGRSRVAGIGEITDSEGKVWTVPAENNFASAPKAVDLYEECAGITPKSIAEVDQDSVPVVVVDPDGEEITGYIFADNYFELYINGTLIAVDSVPFTPFNSSIVKFKVSKPYTIAVKVIDWEENLGLGSENNRGKAFHPGDGGFIASFSDGTVTNADWQAQTFYTSPIYDLSCLKEVDGQRLSEGCSTQGTDNGQDAYAVRWQTPNDWMVQGFDSTSWPEASLYTEVEIGVNNKKAYMNFIEKFSGAGASFIWSSNVVLDNEVLLRYEVK